MTKNWYLSSAEHIGKSHIRDNIPCQDSTHIAFKNGVYVSSLSDGCSSEDLSHVGSKIICESVCELLINQFDDLYNQKDGGAAKVKIVDYLGNAVKKEADKQGVKELNRFRATLVFAAVKGDQVITGRFGDGTLGMIKDGKLKIYLYEKKTGDAEDTSYLIDRFPAVAANLKSVFDIKKTTSDKITGFLMMSDGSELTLISKPYRKGYWSFAPVFKQIFSEHVLAGDAFKGLHQLVEKVAEKCPKNDDCSLAIMSREDVGLVEIEPLPVDIPNLPPIDEMPLSYKVVKPSTQVIEPVKPKLDVNTYLNSPIIKEYSKILDKVDFQTNIASKENVIQVIKWLANKSSTLAALSTGTKLGLSLVETIISNLIELNSIQIQTNKESDALYTLI